MDSNSRLYTRRGTIFLYYTKENACFLFCPEIPTTNPYNPSVISGDLDADDTAIIATTSKQIIVSYLEA
jgi:hypothetical protein